MGFPTFLDLFQKCGIWENGNGIYNHILCMCETVMNFVLFPCVCMELPYEKMSFFSRTCTKPFSFLTYCRCMHKIAMEYCFMCDDFMLSFQSEGRKDPTFDCFGSCDLLIVTRRVPWKGTALYALVVLTSD